MLTITKMDPLLSRSEVERLAETALAGLVISGVRLVPLRAALALLLGGLRVRVVCEGRTKDARRTHVPPRTVRCLRAPAVGHTTKGGSRHG